jgi:hypothetical protein
LNSWSADSGYLPVYVSGLEAWSGKTYYSALQQLLPSAALVPGNDTLDEIGPVLRDAVIGVLKDQELPEVVVSALLEKVLAP